MTTLELIQHYVKLLILQYTGKPRATATIETQTTPVLIPQTSVQTISFALAPTSGSFVVSYDDNASAAIAWNDSVGTIQSKLQAIPGLSEVAVVGAIASLLLTVTFVGVLPAALLLEIDSSTLLSTATPVDPVVTETDLTLPLAVQNGFNLIAPNIASGVQLDTLGKYAGVTRSALGFTSNIVLDDADFLSLIKIAIVKNTSGSSLQAIQQLLFDFFPGDMLVFDYRNMTMSYYVSTNVGSQDLLELFITEKLLPRPMAVLINVVVIGPTVDKFFGFRTYTTPAVNSTPFNSYTDYHTDWYWLSYANAF